MAFYLVVGVESHDDFEQGLQSNKTKAAPPENPEICHWAKAFTDLLLGMFNAIPNGVWRKTNGNQSGVMWRSFQKTPWIPGTAWRSLKELNKDYLQ